MFIVTWFFETLRDYPEIAIFLTLAFGYYFGKFTFRGIGLGSVTATLLAGVLIGQIGINRSRQRPSCCFYLPSAMASVRSSSAASLRMVYRKLSSP
jgi:putative transport protein